MSEKDFSKLSKVRCENSISMAEISNSLDFPSVCVRIEERTLERPSAIAVQWQDQQLSYGKLNAKANQIARFLRSRELENNALIGLCVDRSFDLVASVLGIFKAGYAYLPLDPQYPQARLNLMLEDASPALILTQSNFEARLSDSQSGEGIEIWCLDKDEARFAEQDVENLDLSRDRSDLAYMIYTSGSTGRPKGVMIEQCALASFVQSATEAYGICADDRVLQFSSISFDVAAEEIYPCLLAGGTLVLKTPEMMASVPAFLEYCGQYGVTVLDLPTAFWHLIVAELVADPELQIPDSVRSIIFGGEAVNGERVRQWQKRFAGQSQQIQLINAYGPTETTVDAIVYPIPQQLPQLEQESDAYSAIPIGKPLPRVTVHILDEEEQEVASGEEGELYIGGEQLARGYLHRPDLTAERFIPNPFGSGRLYKTGDWCRILPDGNVAYLGRIDSQVKIRGFRVELGEIEAALLEQAQVQEVAVVAHRDRQEQQHLVAYVVMAASDTFEAASLRSVLVQKMPPYMVPSVFVELEALPLTPSDKVDRKDLTARELPKLSSSTTVEGEGLKPQTETEMALANLWQQSLGAEGDSPKLDDNFFEGGGTSLIAMQLLAKVEKAFDQQLQLSDLFEAPTLRGLAQHLEQLAQGLEQQKTSVIPLWVKGDRPPLFFLNSGTYARQLVSLLGTDQPLYNLNIFNIAAQLSADLDGMKLEAIAQTFIADMRSIQPEGPYYITGFCADSKLAVEMGHQLRGQGETVAWLGLIDPMWDEPQQKMAAHLTKLRQFGLAYLIEKFKDLWANLQNATAKDAQLQEVQLQAGMNSEQSVSQDLALLRRYETLCLDHQPKPYEGPTTVIFSGETELDPCPKLGEVLGEEFDSHVIPGFHMALFEELPNRQQLALCIQRSIEQTL